jgi:uncharacterized membrane protein YkoI
VVVLLLLVPSVAAAALAMRFELAPVVQDPAQQEKELKEKERSESRTAVEVKERKPFDPRFAEEIRRRQEVEMEMRALKHAALVRSTRVTMDQAIQIASSQVPGTVMACNLDADKWEEPGKLARDGVVFYRVVVADQANPSALTHVFVNAVDGSIIKTEKELPRKMRSPENQ